MSSLERNLVRKEFNRLTPRPLGPLSRSSGPRCKRDFKPISYKSYFDEHVDIKIPESEDTFRVYVSGFQANPSDSLLLVLLHGGGYSGLTWSLFSKCVQELCVCRIASIDLRGHGGTVTADESDMSSQTLAHDVGQVVKALLDQTGHHDELPPIVIVGHSMGGALAVHCTVLLQEILPTIVGMIVIDVVEGTALEALQSMQSLLRGRPKSFATLEKAIEWCLRSGQTKNLEAAKVSMPGQLKNLITSKLGADEVDDSESDQQASDDKPAPRRLFVSDDQILEEAETNEEEKAEPVSSSRLDPPQSDISNSSVKDNEYSWRIDLSKTEPYWKGWFQGLSDLFLSSPVQGKLLLLAGIDSLDRQLTIGQMQGKFQMQVLPQVGHAVHEDSPEKVADAVATFLVRNRFTVAKNMF
ncbi:protein phosphatase methylesterase 1 [Brevipalpus obovatus]|uniref:protein phosphatase methylesterase 1 n=1 Tax=Brevipalpus obovatus TaxID=246614 RepID=UPI003D9E4A2C